MKKWLAAIVVLGAIGLATGRALRGGSSAARPADTVTTYTVKTEKFVRRVTAEGNLEAVKATQLAAPRPSSGGFGPMKIAWLAADGINVKAGQVVVRFDPSDPEKQLRDGEADLAAAQAKLGSETIKSKAAVRGRETDAVLASDELADQRKFQAKDDQIFSRNQIIESQIDEQLAGAKQAHAEDAKHIEQHRSGTNAAVISVERQKAELTIRHAKEALGNMEITAPHDGIFVLRRNWRGELPKLGQAMWPGQQVAEIPLLDQMEADVYVLEVDGSGLAEKQPAEVVIEAHPELVFKGAIKLVDKLAQPRNDGSPVQYFGVKIALDKTDLAVMKPGGRVRATLVLDQEDAIAVPRQAVMDVDGKPVVYRRGAKGFEPVPVELGAATSGRVVIKKGLAAGDVIALRDPTRAPEQAGSGSSAAEPGPSGGKP